MKINRKTIVILTILMLLIASFGLFTYMQKENSWTTGQRKVKKYTYVEPYGGTCMAVSPGCGVCFGEIVDKECLVTKQEYDEFKEVYPSLEVE